MELASGNHALHAGAAPWLQDAWRSGPAAGFVHFFWVHYRMPFGATFLCAALLVGEWLDRYINFWGWTYYPVNLIWPTSLIPQALFLDIVLLLTKSWSPNSCDFAMAPNLVNDHFEAQLAYPRAP